MARPPSREPAAIARTFVAGDEPRLLDIWNRAYGSYAGQVRRTVEYWRWSIVERPGITPDDVVILTGGDGPIAYGVLGPAGAVLELAVDPAIVGQRREAVAAQLTQALEERCRTRGGETISFVLPHADDAVQRVLQRAGYRSESSSSFTATVVDVATLLDALLRHRQDRFPSGWSPTFRLVVERGADRVYPRLVTRVRIGPPLVIEAEAPEAGAPVDEVDCTISLALSALNRIVLRRGTFDDELAHGRVSVGPAGREHDARTLMSLITLTAPWYTPNADGR